MAKNRKSTKNIKPNDISTTKSPTKQTKVLTDNEEVNKENIFTWFGIIVVAFAMLLYIMTSGNATAN
ncbi:MAG: hypothetical protein LBG67_04645 [Campylobacteraceae bacterium]|nr:hypothetical protein [Campylobacteraceae bacterium]